MRSYFGGMSQFWSACCFGDLAAVERLLRDPHFAVAEMNDADVFGRSPLSVACANNHGAIVSLLLKDPRLSRESLNRRNEGFWTALDRASFNGHLDIVKDLLADHRLDHGDLHLPDKHGRTTLSAAICNGRLEIVKWLLAAEEPGTFALPDHVLLDDTQNGDLDVLDVHAACRALMRRYNAAPSSVRRSLRVELGLLARDAAQIFAAVVFLCEGLVQVPTAAATSRPGRFLSVLENVPLELQMLLCWRAVEEPRREIIPSRDSEPAFRELALFYSSPEVDSLTT